MGVSAVFVLTVTVISRDSHVDIMPPLYSLLLARIDVRIVHVVLDGIYRYQIPSMLFVYEWASSSMCTTYCRCTVLLAVYRYYCSRVQ